MHLQIIKMNMRYVLWEMFKLQIATDVLKLPMKSVIPSVLSEWIPCLTMLYTGSITFMLTEPAWAQNNQKPALWWMRAPQARHFQYNESKRSKLKLNWSWKEQVGVLKIRKTHVFLKQQKCKCAQNAKNLRLLSCQTVGQTRNWAPFPWTKAQRKYSAPQRATLHQCRTKISRRSSTTPFQP